jgi:hypothetical protein
MRKRQAVKLKEYFKRPILSKGVHSRTEGVQERHVRGLKWDKLSECSRETEY